MTQASDTQIQFLLDLAYTNACLDTDEIQTYLDKFRQMTEEQARDLIGSWQVVGRQRPIDNAKRVIWRGLAATLRQTTPQSAPRATPAPVTGARLITAKFPKTCSMCHKQILTGQAIWYIKGYIATHQSCGTPTVVSGRQNVAPSTPTASTHQCPRCAVTFSARDLLERHYRTAHMSSTNPPVHPSEPVDKVVLPMKGYYAIELPIDGAMTWRFYRVTESRKYVYGANHPEAGQKVRSFRRISGDNMLGIEPQERAIAAAMINAAPGLAQEAYGKKIGHCGCCGRQLTDPESRARGIGPECFGRYGQRYI